ncbi:Obscurin [Lamellibrachia satsuma]|nr:Obscurin [Lamellibrachia satsuma]
MGETYNKCRRSVEGSVETITVHDVVGFPPIFKEKIRDKAYNVGDSCTLRVHLIGRPRPAVSWYRNEELLTDGGRVRTASSDDGHFSLTVLSTKPHDFGVYKCVARNRYGTVTCRARMLLGDHPSRPGRPHVTKVSNREAYMIWEEPESDGNNYITSYRVDWHRPGDERWTNATYCIDECALVKGLRASTTYRFRVAAINQFGTSPYSWASVEIKTKDKGAEPINIDCITKKILLRSRQATSRPSPETSPVASPGTTPFGSTEDLSGLAEKKTCGGDVDREIELQEIDPEKFLEFGSEIWRGRFSLIRNVKPKQGRGQPRVVKIIPYDPLRPDDCLREMDLLKAVRQEHIVRLYEGYVWNDFVFLVFEKFYGENVARSLSLKNKYNEYHVTSIIKQVLDGCQFLHHRGIVHLNLQPDSVIMVSRRRFDVKLVDFGRSRKITSYDGEPVPREGMAEFMAPEKVAREDVGVAADIWGIGVLAFILLSGVSPFYADSEDEMWTNIKSVRYDVHLLYHNVTKYALKFLYQTLRRNPKSRLSTADCLDDRWFQLSPHMVKYRKAALFATDKLRAFEENYVARRMAGAAPCSRLVKAYGGTAAEFIDDTDDVFTSAQDS